ncbi:MAG: insulinase family protein [Firmicutes bacterium]|nr:insulinase family protein [Bacillota bacterium]
MDFTHCNLGAGVRLHLCETDKFNTVTLKMFIQQDLAPDSAAATAIIPALLKRGSQRFPSTRQIARELEYLHAASFSADVLKIGERQLLEFYFDMIDPTLLPDGEENGKRALATFWDIAMHPVTEGNGFVQEYFDQEKLNLRRDVEGLINDKRAYALARAVELMCPNEPYGVYRYGSVSAIDALQNTAAYRCYQDLLATRPIDIFLVGRNLDLVANEIARLEFSRREAATLEPPVVREPEGERWHEEEVPAQQSVLVLGYRTQTRYPDPDYYGLVVCNGVLGGFPHSKLFVNVRERASLAYYVGSFVDGTKGVLMINAGISAAKVDQAVGIIKEQVNALQQGQITPEELEQTKTGLCSSIAAMADDPSSIIDRNLVGLVNGEMRSFDDVFAAIRGVTAADVQKAAQALRLDTVYVLKGSSEKE